MIRKKICEMEETKKVALLNMMIKPLGLIISFVSVPLLLKYFDNEKYGLWATLLSITTWINFFDMGLGNGLRNKLTEYASKKDYNKFRKSFSTTFLVILFVGFIIYILLILSLFVFDWNKILNTSYSLSALFLVFFGFVCLNFVFSISNSILYSMQMPLVVSLKGYFAQIINLCGLVILSLFFKGNFELMAALYGSSTLITHIFSFYYVKRKINTKLFNFSDFDYNSIKNISYLGFRFFIIQLCCLIIFSTDNILISHFFGTEAVTPFSITDKLFTTLYSFLAALVVPYWSNSTVAYNSKNFDWYRNSLFFLIKVLVIFIICYFILYVLFIPITKMWIGPDVLFDNDLTLTMCIYYCIYSILTIECQLINGTGKINTQLIIYIIVAIINIPLSIFLGVNLGLKSTGIRLATVILLFIETIILGINLYKIIWTIKKEKDKYEDYL